MGTGGAELASFPPTWLRKFMRAFIPVVLLALLGVSAHAAPAARPNVVLIMADDQGWGETGYNGHPVVKTPVLDEMARTALRFDRFYAASPLCTPSRASIMTGRHANRSGAFSPNWSIRPEEITIAQVLRQAGYRTGHFGKWHLGPVKKDSPLNPGRMGFEEYLSHDNYFEMNPPLSRNGAPPEIVPGESSEVCVDAAVTFMRKVHRDDPSHPFFIVIWFGSPHAPYSGKPEDLALYRDLTSANARGRFAEITAMDRAIGTFRAALRELGVAENTLVWFNSDNGIDPPDHSNVAYNGGWRGVKAELYEGGLRVPAIIEWPQVIRKPRVSSVIAVTTDIFPTVLDLLQLQSPVPDRPLDGISLRSLIVDDKMKARPSPIGFWKYPEAGEKKNPRWLDAELSRGTTPTVRNPAIQFENYHHPEPKTHDFGGQAAWLNNRYKLLVGLGQSGPQLYDLTADPYERRDVAREHPDIVKSMTAEMEAWQRSVELSLSGRDYSAETNPKKVER